MNNTSESIEDDVVPEDIKKTINKAMDETLEESEDDQPEIEFDISETNSTNIDTESSETKSDTESSETPTIDISSDITERKVPKRNLAISIISMLLVFAVILLWVINVIINQDEYNQTIYIVYNESNTTFKDFPYQYTWFISVPLAFFLMIFPANALVSSVFNMFCPIWFLKYNSKFYSCRHPNFPINSKVTNDEFETPDFTYPSVTIQIPVYKESLESVIKPTIRSLIECRDFYSGEIDVNILISDDGLQLISSIDKQERIRFYENNNIGYISRPPQNRKGKFKKASNLNFSMAISRIYTLLIIDNNTDPINTIKKMMRDINCDIDLGGNLSIGDYILLVDADTRIPKNCLLGPLIEFMDTPNLAFTQHLTLPLIIYHSYWESFIGHFTTLIYKYSIMASVAGGNETPLVGHNVILRKKAMYNAIKVKPENINKDLTDSINDFQNCDWKYPKPWSEENVSEDFRLFIDFSQIGSYGRYVTYTNGFTEGVSLTYDDEVMKFEKYVYGSCEILFNPIIDWISCRKPPISKTICNYLNSKVDFSSKYNLLGYLFTYIALGTGVFMSYLNYFMYGWYEELMINLVLPTDVLIQIIILFTVVGLISHVVLMARLEKRCILHRFWIDIKHIPFYLLFFGSLQYPISKVIMKFIFCKDAVSWGSTVKEIGQSDRKQAFKETLKRYTDTYVIFILTTIMMIVFALPVIPEDWRITSTAGIVPLALTTAAHLLAPILLNPRITSKRI